MSIPKPGTYGPASGADLDAVRASSTDEIVAAVDAARAAQEAWAGRSLADRAAMLERAVDSVLRDADTGAQIVLEEAGKSKTDTLINEISSLGPYVKTAIAEAKVALAPVKVQLSALEYPGKRATIEAVPRGVVGIIAPWNYPIANFFKPIFPALLAGNGIVAKPSEYTPRSAAWLLSHFQSHLPEGLVQVVQGGGDVGAALIDSGIDAVVFTGSVATGRKVAEAAAKNLIPASVELGGKDAAIVLADCDLDRTAVGVAQWAFHNCGQNCAAIERVYVEDRIADQFIEKLADVASNLKVTPDGEHADIGAVQSHAQLQTVETHVADAVSKGAKVVVGGSRTGVGLGYRATVLDRCDETMDVLTDETFGPVVAIRRVRDADEAVRLANDSPYGLNGSVWTKDIERGMRIARRLEVGVALVNNHAFPGSMAHVPWTGTKETGTGVAASRFAYPTFVRRRTLFVDKGSKPDPWWFPMNADLREMSELLIARALGSFGATFKLAGVAGRRVKAVQELARAERRAE